MIAAPLAMLIAIRPLLIEHRRRPLASAWPGRTLAVAFVGGAALLELPGPARRAGRAARARRRAARLPADRPRQAGALRGPGPLRRLRAARRRHPRAAGRVPRRRRLPEPREAVRHRRRLQPDRLRLLLARRRSNRFPYVITGRAAWNSQAPPNFKRDRRDPLLRALGTDRRRRPRTATSCSRGPRPAPSPTAPRRRSASSLANPGRASLFPDAVIGAKGALGRRAACSAPASATSQTLRLPARPLAPLAPVLLALRPDPQRAGLQRAAEGRARRPAAEHDQPRQQRPVLARRRDRERRRPGPVHASPPPSAEHPAEPQRLRRQGLRRRAGRGPRRAAPHRAAAAQACDGWIDWYESAAVALSSSGGLGGQALGRDPDHVPDQAELLEAVDDEGRDVDLPAAEAVGGGGREGVVVVVPGLAEGRDRDQGQVARLVGGLEVAVAEDVAERVDAVGEVVQDEDADEAAPEQAGDAPRRGCRRSPSRARRGAAGRRSPSR